VAGTGQRAKPPVHTLSTAGGVQIVGARVLCSTGRRVLPCGSVEVEGGRGLGPVQLAEAAYGLGGGQRLHGHAALLPYLLVGPLGDGVSDAAPAQQPPAGGGTAHSRSDKG
jgi:hypothetical protein